MSENSKLVAFIKHVDSFVAGTRRSSVDFYGGWFARQPEIDALKQEIAALRTGDTCGRQCEGTAYRIEAGKLKRDNEQQAEEIARLELMGKEYVQNTTTKIEQLHEQIEELREACADAESAFITQVGADYNNVIAAAVKKCKTALATNINRTGEFAAKVEELKARIAQLEPVECEVHGFGCGLHEATCIRKEK